MNNQLEFTTDLYKADNTYKLLEKKIIHLSRGLKYLISRLEAQKINIDAESYRCLLIKKLIIRVHLTLEHLRTGLLEAAGDTITHRVVSEHQYDEIVAYRASMSPIEDIGPTRLYRYYISLSGEVKQMFQNNPNKQRFSSFLSEFNIIGNNLEELL